MELQISSSYHPIDPMPESLDDIIQSLATVEESFFVLSEGEATYLQGTWTKDGGFELEYQEDSIVNHYRFKDAVAVPLAIEIANRYLEGDTSWQTHPHWVHEPLESQAETPGHAISLGNFEGIALRQAIAALEAHDIKFLVEPAGHDFVLYSAAETADEAKRILAASFGTPHEG
jgi:hypothetical protein